MSDVTTEGQADSEDTATKAKGRHEKELNEQAAEHRAEEKRAEQEAEALEQQDKPAEPTDPDQLRGEIAEAREELGDTVEALAAKTDVKAQAKEKLDEQKARAQAKVDETTEQVQAKVAEATEQVQAKVAEATEQVKQKPAPAAAVAGGVFALLLLILFLKRRR